MTATPQDLGQVDLAKAVTIEREYDSSIKFTFELGRWVTKKGMLIPLRKQIAKDTPVRFDYKLSNGREILSGTGKVVWYKEAAGQRPAGIGIGFLTLSERSKKNVKMILDWKEANDLS